VAGDQGRVEQIYHRRGGAKAVDYFAEEGGAECGFCGERGGDAPLAVEDEVHCGVVCGEAFGRAGERRAFEFVHEGREFFGAEKAAEFVVVGEQVLADGAELFALGHVAAGGDDDLLGRDGDVVAGAGGFFEAFAGPPGGEVFFVRCFVGGEARVAVDAHHDFLRRAHVGGGEVVHGFVDFADEGEHRGFEFALEGGFAWGEPVAVVVAG